MRILYILERAVYGGEKATWNLANVVCKNGLEVGVYCSGATHNPYSNEGIELFDAYSRSPQSLKFIFRLLNTIIKFKPDIIHATGMYTGVISIILRFISQHNFKIVMVIHHTHQKFRHHNISTILINYLRYIDVIVFLTEYQRVHFSKFGLKPKKYLILPNVNVIAKPDKTEVINLRKELLKNLDSNFLICYVGRLIEAKQINIFLETVALIRSKGKHCSGVIVGKADNPEYMNYLTNLSDSLGISKWISFEGFSNNPESYYAATDLFLLPSQQETFPVSLMEAYAIGKPVVVSNIPQLKSIVKDGENGLIAEIHTPECYASKVLKIMEDNILRRKIEENNLQTYELLYNPEKVAKEYIILYNSII